MDYHILKVFDPLEVGAELLHAASDMVDAATSKGVLDISEHEQSPDGDGEKNEADLTDRETAVLKGVAKGLSNRAIANQLWVTEQTVKFHLTNIYRKLDVNNRTEATRIYLLAKNLAGPDIDQSILKMQLEVLAAKAKQPLSEANKLTPRAKIEAERRRQRLEKSFGPEFDELVRAEALRLAEASNTRNLNLKTPA